ncbi:P-loop containing nucleoside triphosphate hydrolase protein [Thozetella sp. PMI_491]|nr:P-loop containing nucleoside triphosphate hydrolase protein [Thozetella sp. PMI_491]
MKLAAKQTDILANLLKTYPVVVAEEKPKPEQKEESKKSETTDSQSGSDASEEKQMKCEIKHLDRRYDDKDKKYFAERKEEAEKPQQKDWWRLFAYCLVRHYDRKAQLSRTSLYVNSQPLRQLLADVISYFPRDPIDVNDVQINDPYHALFFYREKLEAEGRERFKDDKNSLDQLNKLLEWIQSHFELDIAAHERCASGASKAIAYDHLWTLFPPKEIVYCKLLGQHRAFRTRYVWYDTGDEPGLYMKVRFVDFDGQRLGTRKTQLFIPQYNGTIELKELDAMPLSMVGDSENIRQEMINRGRNFEAYAGQHFMQYSGLGLRKTNEGYRRFSVHGRVIVDCKTYHRLEPDDSFETDELENAQVSERARARKKATGGTDFAPEKEEFDRLSEEEAIIAAPTVRGYSFSAKRFLEFYVDQLQPINWNTKCFDQLVLDPKIKQTVQALVSTHVEQQTSFDDIVEGKGRGLVCVLHGPPGVGKTLTAECVAEYVQRPLYSVSSGDLGVDSSTLNDKLTKIMDMTSTWGAVLLIDEADVFLERRSLHELHRNAMVSVFLRVMEYYKGILFLTTNRVNTFDDAFKSRIHVPIRYTDLSIDSRTQIWRNFCSMVPSGVDIGEADFKKLAKYELNGRQIKNIIKAAESLVTFQKVKLGLEQLEHVAKIQATFDEDLSQLDGVDYTAPGAIRKDADKRNMFL